MRGHSSTIRSRAAMRPMPAAAGRAGLPFAALGLSALSLATLLAGAALGATEAEPEDAATEAASDTDPVAGAAPEIIGEPDMTDPRTCLAITMYWESKGEGEEGMRAVAAAVQNRVAHEDFPDTICAVVTEGSETPPCQFGFWCDGVSDTPVEDEPWELAWTVAGDILENDQEDPTGGALFYHYSGVDPFWSDEKEQTVQIGDHVYYR